MIESISAELGVPASVAWALIALGVVQLVLQIWALVDLTRRPRVRMDKKWLWALIIILGGNMLIGPIVYFAIGRNVPEPVDIAAGPGADGDRTRRAVDTLYGKGEGR